MLTTAVFGLVGYLLPWWVIKDKNSSWRKLIAVTLAGMIVGLAFGFMGLGMATVAGYMIHGRCVPTNTQLMLIDNSYYVSSEFKSNHTIFTYETRPNTRTTEIDGVAYEDGTGPYRSERHYTIDFPWSLIAVGPRWNCETEFHVPQGTVRYVNKWIDS